MGWGWAILEVGYYSQSVGKEKPPTAAQGGGGTPSKSGGEGAAEKKESASSTSETESSGVSSALELGLTVSGAEAPSLDYRTMSQEKRDNFLKKKLKIAYELVHRRLEAEKSGALLQLVLPHRVRKNEYLVFSKLFDPLGKDDCCRKGSFLAFSPDNCGSCMGRPTLCSRVLWAALAEHVCEGKEEPMCVCIR